MNTTDTLTVYWRGPREYFHRVSLETPIFDRLWQILLLRARLQEAVRNNRPVPMEAWEQLAELEEAS